MTDSTPNQALQHQRQLIQEQIEKIDQQIQERLATSERILAKLNEQLETYRAAKTNPQSLTAHSGEINFHRAKEYVQRLIRQTRQQMRDEEVAYWNDLQKLRLERRNLARQQAQLEFRLSLMRGGGNDA